LGNLVFKGIYVNDKKEGSWITYGSKGTITKVETYKHGIRNGVTITIDDSGNLKEEANYKNDVLNGPQRTYASGARLMSEIYYLNGVMNGTKKTYYEANSKLQEESKYKNGLRDSISKWYDTEGKLIAEYFYKDGKFEGTNKTFFSNGNLQSAQKFTNNLENGVYKEYFDSTIVKKTTPADINSKKPSANIDDVGLIKITGNYINGKKEGKWIEYDNKGNIIKTTMYKNDIEKK